MTAQELTRKIHQQLRENPRDEESWLELLAELREFSRTATTEEREELHRICCGGEAFAMAAAAIEHSRSSADEQR